MGLTRYPPTSIREMVAISSPLMITAFSWWAMVFVDRLFLAAYDLEAMNAAVNASIVGWTFINGPSLIASIAEVFVARRYGAGERSTLGAPVWQMLWFALFSIVFYLPFGLFGVSLFYGEGRELDSVYLRWMLYFAPTYLAYQAIAAFFIGQGKTAIIAWAALATNGVNFILDYVLIFGVEGVVPSMGMEGAAIGTSLSTVFQTMILVICFFLPKNRKIFGTFDWKFKKDLFYEEVKVGAPACVAMTLEFIGWIFFYEMMKWLGESHLTLAGIFQSLFMLFYFVPEGFLKGVTALVAFYIGEKKEGYVPYVLIAAAKLITLVFLVLLVTSPLTIHGIKIGFLREEGLSIEPFLFGAWLLVLLYISFEAARSVLMAHLTAYKETSFIMITGAISVLLFIALPMGFLLNLGEPGEMTALFLALLFPLGHTLLLYLRSRTILLVKKPSWD